MPNILIETDSLKLQQLYNDRENLNLYISWLKVSDANALQTVCAHWCLGHIQYVVARIEYFFKRPAVIRDSVLLYAPTV